MGPPSSRPNSGLMIDPALAPLFSTPRNNRDSSTQSAELTGEEKSGVRETNLILRRLEEQDNKLSKMSESINDWKIQNGKLLATLMRSSPAALTKQDTSDVLEALMDDFEFMVNAAYEARSGNDELEILRAENESMKAKLQTIALAMGSATGDFTPSQPLTSPMTASSTPSVLGKRKRMDVRSRHSLLQHEVSFTDDDNLNDQSGIYAVSDVTNMTSTPAGQLERPLTPLLSSVRATQQYGHMPIATTNSTSKQTAAPTLTKTTAQTLNLPDSSFAEQHDRESRSRESDRSLEVEPERSGNPTPEVNGSIYEHEANATSGLCQNTDRSEVVEREVVGTMTVQDAAQDHHENSASISRLQSDQKPTLKIAAATNTHEPELVAVISEQRQKVGGPAKEDEAAELHGRETRASAASPTRRKTTSVLAGEADTEQEGHEVNKETEQQRKTTNTFLEKAYAHPQDRGEPSRPIKAQRVTRAAASQVDYMQETGIANGYAAVREQIPEELAEADLWQDSSMTNLTNDEEREELFERHRDDEHETQTNGNNKENEQPYYAHSADGPQSKQSNRRNRDPNKPKRARRKPDEIERKYQCLFPGCTKAYGELPHLNTHISDSSHGERWTKADYLEASKKQGNNVDYATDLDDSVDFDRLAEERNAAEAVAALKKNQEMVDRVEKLRQRDRKAKEAMEREEMMELMNGV
jgi:hypothetical protein